MKKTYFTHKFALFVSFALLFAPYTTTAMASEDISYTVEVGDASAPENVMQSEQPRIYHLDFSNPRVDVKQILDSGIVVDEIPTLLAATYISLSEAQSHENLKDDDYVVGVDINGEFRFYPLSILNWHQGVNDTVNGEPVFISWDPLTAQPYAINRKLDGRTTTEFGVSGLVYRSTSLYYDRATQSLWSGFMKKAITGQFNNFVPQEYPSYVTQVKFVKSLFPNALTLSRETGYVRDYDTNPYGSYGHDTTMLFPVRYFDVSMPRKEYVLGVTIRRGPMVREVAFPVSSLMEWRQAKGLKFTFGNDIFPSMPATKITVHYLEPLGRFEVTSPHADVQIDMTYSYWFVWSAFHPNTHVVRTLGNDFL